MQFVNMMDGAVESNWIDHGGNEILYTQLAPAQAWLQNTHLTHPWIIRDVESNAPVVGFLPID